MLRLRVPEAAPPTEKQGEGLTHPRVGWAPVFWDTPVVASRAQPG